MRESVRMREIICTTDPEEPVRRDELLKNNGHRMGVVRTSWPLRTGTLRDDTGAGTLGLQARIGVDGIAGWLDDLAAPGRFLLIGADGDPVANLDPAVASGGTHWAG